MFPPWTFSQRTWNPFSLHVPYNCHVFACILCVFCVFIFLSGVLAILTVLLDWLSEWTPVLYPVVHLYYLLWMIEWVNTCVVHCVVQVVQVCSTSVCTTCCEWCRRVNWFVAECKCWDGIILLLVDVATVRLNSATSAIRLSQDGEVLSFLLIFFYYCD